jgi:hypothetical protein
VAQAIEGNLITVDDTNYGEFMSGSKVVFILGKSNCETCSEYVADVESLVGREDFKGTCFCKVILEKRGSISVRRENPWIAKSNYLSYVVLYKNGRASEFVASNGAYLTKMIEDNLLK